MTELGDRALSEFLEAVSSSDPTPGGGSVAAVVGALAASLGAMAAAIRANKQTDESVQTLAAAFETHRAAFMRLSRDDEAAFEEVMAAFRLPKSDPGKANRLEQSLLCAAEVPLDLAGQCRDLLLDLEQMASLATQHSVSDVGAAAYLAGAAAHATLLNVDINSQMMNDGRTRSGVSSRRQALAKQCAELVETVTASVRQRMTA